MFAWAACLAFTGAAWAQPVPRPIYVLNSMDASVSVVDGDAFNEVRRIDVGKEPHHLAATADGALLVVASEASDSLAVIDPVAGTLLRTLDHVPAPQHLAFSPDGRWLVIASGQLDHVGIYRWNAASPDAPLTLARQVRAARSPGPVVIDGASRVAYVSLQDSDEVLAIDLATHRPLWRLPVGHLPAGLLVAPDGRTLLVALTGDRVVEAYDLAHTPPVLRARIATGAGAHGLRAQGDGRHAFVSNRIANTVSRLDLHTLRVVATIPVPGGPDELSVLPGGEMLLVTSRWSRKLNLVDVGKQQVVRQVSVGRSPHGVLGLGR